MGTRADFYIGRGENAEWLGSIAMDGYPDGIRDSGIFDSSSEVEFRERAATFLADCPHATVPSDGWPWPWNDSRTTDYAYAFDGGSVLATCFGYEWFDPRQEEPELPDDVQKVAVFPDMSARKAVTFGPRSGLLVMTAEQPTP